MQGITILFFMAAKTKDVPVRIPNNYYWECLDPRSIIFYLVSNQEVAIVTFCEISDQFMRFGIINKISTFK